MCASESSQKGVWRELVLALLCMGALTAQAETSKDAEQVKRLRLQMRQIQQQQQEAQEAQAKSDQARQQAEQSLKSQESNLQKQRTAAAAASRQAASLAKELEALKAENAKAKEELSALTEKYKVLEGSEQALQGKLRKSEATVSQLGSLGAQLQSSLKRCVSNNTELTGLATELLTRYENKGMSEVLGAHEPFLQLGRVKLENFKAEYTQRIAVQKINPDAVEPDQQ